MAIQAQTRETIDSLGRDSRTQEIRDESAVLHGKTSYSVPVPRIPEDFAVRNLRVSPRSILGRLRGKFPDQLLEPE
jgi:hypothetical protein